jgi:hypothetical protein
LCATLSGSHELDKPAVFYRCCLITTIIGTAFDASSYVFEDWQLSDDILVKYNMITFIIWVVIVFFVGLYVITMIQKRVVVPNWTILPIVALTVADIVFVVIGSQNGQLFTVMDGFYQAGPWADHISFSLFIGTLYL